MDKILHDPKDPKLWELWYIPYNGSCRILSINRITKKRCTQRTHDRKSSKPCPGTTGSCFGQSLDGAFVGVSENWGVPYFGVLIMRDMGAIFGSPLFSETPI